MLDVLVLALLASSSPSPSPTPAPAVQTHEATPEQLQALFTYVKNGWHTLQRNNKGLLAAAEDPKFPPADGKWPVYVADDEDPAKIAADLKTQMTPDDFAKIEVKPLPKKGLPAEPGILYLPKPYVVPGGRFNEMYGWDSYFIQVGLLRDGEDELAKDMVDNFLYEIDHYGMILNANRSYYLTRSQPPFLTEMILGVYDKTGDKAWLASTVPAIEKYYALWTHDPHLTKQTGLSRYHDLGQGPAPEVLSGEKDENGLTHYDRIKQWYEHNTPTGYDVSQYFDKQTDTLTPLFYVADRSMRESGFDPSNRFGEFNIGVLDYDPVCLNSLLYQMEVDATRIERILGHEKKAKTWAKRADDRKAAVNKYLWDDASGLYLDYDFVTGKRRDYPFGATFFAMWAGIPSKDQAAKLREHALALLEKGGGLDTSTSHSGNQWDDPFGWAPLQLMAAKGLRRYGYDDDADRLTVDFLSLVLAQFVEHNAIFEKYDVVARQSAVASGIKFGYSSNEIGFGWTNATFVELYADLPAPKKDLVRGLDGMKK